MVGVSETQELIARLWARFQPLALERARLVVAYLQDDAADGTRHAAARQAAHDLVGSLGSYGRPEGSVLARRLEEVLGAEPAALAVAGRAEALTLAAALESEVAR